MEKKTQQKKKLDLNKITVSSFITTLKNDEQKKVKGGSSTEIGITSIRIFC